MMASAEPGSGRGAAEWASALRLTGSGDAFVASLLQDCGIRAAPPIAVPDPEALAWRERYEALVRASGQLVLDWDLAADIVHCSGEGEAVTGFPASALQGSMERLLRWLVHPQDRDALGVELSRARLTGSPLETRFRIVRADGLLAQVCFRAHPAGSRDGQPARLVGSIVRVEEPREPDEGQALLLREMNHRVKNTLAVVQSIARRTLHGIPGAEAPLEAFTGRLHALAAVHGLLTEQQWRGADLGALVTAQAAPYAGDRMRLNGPQVRLESNMAQTFALVIHELAVNAAKYGALWAAAGEVEVRWNVEDGWLRLVWDERGGPAIETPPERRGFGSTLIRTIVERSQGGQVRFDFRREGLRCSVEVPLGTPA